MMDRKDYQMILASEFKDKSSLRQIIISQHMHEEKERAAQDYALYTV